MTDKELRGIVLNRFYERRRENDQSFIVLTEDDFDEGINRNEAISICGQLAEKGLLSKWKQNMEGSGSTYGTGKISAFGVDVVEGSATPPIAIKIDRSKHITVSASQNVQVGNSNHMELTDVISELSHAIEKSNGSEKEKEEAKSLLKSFLSHPLVAAITGGLAGGV